MTSDQRSRIVWGCRRFLCFKVVANADTDGALPLLHVLRSRRDATAIPAVGELAQGARVQLGPESLARARLARPPHNHRLLACVCVYKHKRENARNTVQKENKKKQRAAQGMLWCMGWQGTRPLHSNARTASG